VTDASVIDASPDVRYSPVYRLSREGTRYQAAQMADLCFWVGVVQADGEIDGRRPLALRNGVAENFGYGVRYLPVGS
jgi:hypothetical protein